MPIAKQVIRILVGWGRMSVQDFCNFALSVYLKMTENSTVFPKPPVDLETLKGELGRFQSLISEAGFNDSRVIVERDQLRGEIHRMLRQLAHYVEGLIDIETDRTTGMQLVAQSGFRAMSSTGSPDEMLGTRISRVDNPRTGVLHVRYPSAGRKAGSYQVRMAVKGTSDPDSWPIRGLANARDGALYESLTPGLVYTFQVRVVGPLGHGDWSPAVDKMCT